MPSWLRITRTASSTGSLAATRGRRNERSCRSDTDLAAETVRAARDWLTRYSSRAIRSVPGGEGDPQQAAVEKPLGGRGVAQIGLRRCKMVPVASLQPAEVDLKPSVARNRDRQIPPGRRMHPHRGGVLASCRRWPRGPASPAHQRCTGKHTKHSEYSSAAVRPGHHRIVWPPARGILTGSGRQHHLVTAARTGARSPPPGNPGGTPAPPRSPAGQVRRSHRGRYHTDRQPGDAAQYTARCPARCRRWRRPQGRSRKSACRRRGG